VTLFPPVRIRHQPAVKSNTLQEALLVKRANFMSPAFFVLDVLELGNRAHRAIAVTIVTIVCNCDGTNGLWK
jgi:hypothetical protein